MSAVLENSLEEVEDLAGATIMKVWISPEDGDWGFPVVRMRVRYRDGFQVNGSAMGEYEIWQDVEGNGPGFIAFVGDPEVAV